MMVAAISTKRLCSHNRDVVSNPLAKFREQASVVHPAHEQVDLRYLNPVQKFIPKKATRTCEFENDVAPKFYPVLSSVPALVLP